MKKKIGIISYLISLIPLLIYIIISVAPNITLNEFGRLVLLCSSVIFMYFGGLLISKHRKDNKLMKINLKIFFILYLILLITLTLYDSGWGRNGIHFNKITNIKEMVNLVPFKTIKLYLRQFDSLYSTKQVLLNLFGNVLAFMPMAIFLPLIFKKQNKTIYFIITIIVSVISIEILQLISLSGRCDIDDVILNVFGALLLYFILKIKSVRNLVGNILLLEDNKVTIKSIIIISICSILCLLSVIKVVKHREELHSKNVDEFYSKYNYSLEIIDETEMCADALDKFYEDDIYEYYFSCIKSNSVYVLINNKEKYLVKDILNNNTTKYVIDINRLERVGLKFIKTNKYNSIDIEIKSSKNGEYNYKAPKIEFIMDNEDIIDLKYSDTSFFEDKYRFKLHIIPKSEGYTKLKINSIVDDDVIDIIKYDIKVDKNLKVSY